MAFEIKCKSKDCFHSDPEQGDREREYSEELIENKVRFRGSILLYPSLCWNDAETDLHKVLMIQQIVLR